MFLKLKKKGFFHLIISNYSVQFIVFGSHLLVAKIMTPSDVGIIKTIETFINMAIVLGGGGAIFALLKIIPENKDKELRNYSLRFAIKYVVVFSITIFIAFNLLAYFEVISKNRELVFWFYQYSFIIVPSVVVMLLIRYYQAIDLFKRISGVILVLKFSSALFVLTLTYFFFIRGYVLSMVITTIIVMLSLIYDIRKTIFISHISKDYIEIKKRIIALSKTAFFAQIIDQFKLHSGFFIANYVLFDRIMFGHYAFALIIIQGLNIVSTSVQQFIIPKMSEVSSDIPLFFDKLSKFELKFILISTLIFAVTQLVFPICIGMVFGSKYNESILLLRIMLIGWYIQSFYALKGIYFLSLGKMKYVSYASFLIFLISVPLMYWLNVRFEAKGAAFAYVLQNVISYLVLSFFVKNLYKTYRRHTID
ncbi:hypothetical protein C1H87_12005 [Flavivirga eckloniae]|uniref:Polysaccharide biosynthesis protein C-terminal domain-containing protein n=1 Tax=Flavivirga eckloniae TaxID=1803846 RepID=A0A2K9PQP8_9FLAO|nr:hypothetical protein C1H87_12005 [Flavivirga eckloniae]